LTALTMRASMSRSASSAECECGRFARPAS
jgi:hypothetical protein